MKFELLETSLDDNWQWVDIDFTTANDLSPSQGVCLVVAQVSSKEKAAKIKYEDGANPMTAGTHWMTSDDGGVSWTGQQTDKDMQFYVYGTYDTFNGAGTRQVLVGVRFQLQLGSNSNAMVNAVRTDSQWSGACTQ